MSNPGRRIAVHITVWIIVGVTAVIGTPPMTAAEPGPAGPEVTVPGPPVPAPPTVAWPVLGRSDRLEIVGSDQPVETEIPVPPGMAPGVLTGLIGSVVNTVDGRIDVLDGRGMALGSIPAPAEQSSIPFAVDISGAQFVDAWHG